jgi:murein DD-endopeptidase MepM/ murein hydrolase activator NlpD
VDRRRVERWRRALLVVGLSFALGALAAIGLSWRLVESEPPPPAAMTATEAEIASLEAKAAHDELPAPATHPVLVAPAGQSRLVAPTATTGSDGDTPDIEVLRRKDLEIPVEDVDDEDLHDTFADPRGGGRSHEAIDIMAPRGTAVVAVEGGRIAKLFNSKQGGLSIYHFDPTGTFTYYYAHLDRYAAGLKEGQPVKRGDVIGFVGSTGNAAEDAPHLHFAIFRLTAERQWWKGTPINPYPVLR